MAEYKYIKYDKDGMGEYSDTLGPGRNVVIGDGQSRAGAGRGKQGGSTARELQKYEDKQDAGIYTKEKGKSPMDPEGAKKRGGIIKKMAKGGMTSSASKRADGCCVKGKTKGRML